MEKIKHFLLIHMAILVLIALFGCQKEKSAFPVPKSLPKETNNFKSLVGYWYGEIKQSDGTFQKHFVTIKNDGTIAIHFKTYKDEKLEFEQIEKGEWGADDTTYITVIKLIEVDGVDYQPPTTSNTRRGLCREI